MEEGEEGGGGVEGGRLILIIHAFLTSEAFTESKPCNGCDVLNRASDLADRANLVQSILPLILSPTRIRISTLTRLTATIGIKFEG